MLRTSNSVNCQKRRVLTYGTSYYFTKLRRSFAALHITGKWYLLWTERRGFYGRSMATHGVFGTEHSHHPAGSWASSPVDCAIAFPSGCSSLDRLQDRASLRNYRQYVGSWKRDPADYWLDTIYYRGEMGCWRGGCSCGIVCQPGVLRLV